MSHRSGRRPKIAVARRFHHRTVPSASARTTPAGSWSRIAARRMRFSGGSAGGVSGEPATTGRLLPRSDVIDTALRRFTCARITEAVIAPRYRAKDSRAGPRVTAAAGKVMAWRDDRRRRRTSASPDARATTPPLSTTASCRRSSPRTTRWRRVTEIDDRLRVRRCRTWTRFPTAPSRSSSRHRRTSPARSTKRQLGPREIPGTYVEYLHLLHDVFAECVEKLEPGGRIAVNVANLGRKPYRSLSADVIRILQDELGLLLRGEVIWQKARGSAGSCAWGSFRRPPTP